MWLLNAETHGLEWFTDPQAVGEGYAILSHTWDVDEVSFQDMQNLDLARRKMGYEKIRFTCDQALRDGFKYAWVDTGCIDKKSSAELSEAINSMFNYYKRSRVCYVYLSDVFHDSEDPWIRIDTANAADALGHSKWFTRGWTLQELIAPSIVEFFGDGWHRIGTKSELANAIAKITGIDLLILRKPLSLREYSIAQRMAWAVGRKTTRSEDRAYSLLGLFGVNMAPMYGEESEKAFLRLQQEIMKTSDDQSILLWQKDHTASADHYSLLATSPDQFSAAREIVSIEHGGRYPFELTNSGVRIPLHVRETTKGTMLVFNCSCSNDPNQRLALSVLPQIRPCKVDPTGVHQYQIEDRTLQLVPATELAGTDLRTCLLVNDLRFDHSSTLSLGILADEEFSSAYEVCDVAPESYWNPRLNAMRWAVHAGVARDDFRGFIAWKHKGTDSRYIVLPFDFCAQDPKPHNRIDVFCSRTRLSCGVPPFVLGSRVQSLASLEDFGPYEGWGSVPDFGDARDLPVFEISVRRRYVSGEDVYTIKIVPEPK